eukprot:7068084-Heterocapsa_arctica.AAC.1
MDRVLDWSGRGESPEIRFKGSPRGGGKRSAPSQVPQSTRPLGNGRWTVPWRCISRCWKFLTPAAK